MKILRILPLFGYFGLSIAWAQRDVPPNPMVTSGKFKTRSTGGGVDSGASLDQSKTAETKVRYITHIVLFEYRMWTSTEGKPLEAKLIAFEDLVAETPKGATEPVMPQPPANPTVTRDGKIRLLVNKKPVEVALDRLCQSDREFIDQMKASLAKKAAEGR